MWCGGYLKAGVNAHSTFTNGVDISVANEVATKLQSTQFLKLIS